MLPDRKELIDALLLLVGDNDGVLRPADVVEAATPTTSPLHKYFDWDDAHAAHQHRLDQARRLMRVTVLVRRGSDTTHLPLLTSLSPGRVAGASYHLTADVRADPVMSLQADLDVLAQCERILVRANSPRLSSVLHMVALAIAQLEADGTRRLEPAEEARVS